MSVVIDRNGKEYLVDEMAAKIAATNKYNEKRIEELYSVINWFGMELDNTEVFDWSELSEVIWNLYKSDVLDEGGEDIGTEPPPPMTEEQLIEQAKQLGKYEEYVKNHPFPEGEYHDLPF